MSKCDVYVAIAAIGFLASFALPVVGEEYSSSSNSATKKEKSDKLGESSDNPVVFEGVKNFKKLRELQENYLDENYPGYKIKSLGSFTNRYERAIRSYGLVNEEGREVSVYFDMEEERAEYRKKNATKLNRMEEQVRREYKKVKQPIGLSFAQPVFLKKVITQADIDQREKEFLAKNYPDYQVKRKEIWYVGKNFLEIVKIENGEEKETIHFEISDYVKEYRKTKSLRFKKLYEGAFLVELL